MSKNKLCIYETRAKVNNFENTLIGQDNVVQISRGCQYFYLSVFLGECLNLNLNNIVKKYNHKINQFGKIKIKY